MATLQGKAVKNTYRQVLQIGANNVGVSGTLQPVQDGTGTNTALSLSTAAATINGTLTITGDLIITGGGIQIQDLIDDTVASLIQNGTGITWAYNDTLRTLTPTITIATADGGVQGDFLQLNVNANEASAVGKLKWNTTDGTMDIGLMGGNVVLQVGQEQVARVLNNSGTIFTEAGYQAVKITSAQGQRLAVGLAQANNEANSKDTLGLVTENIANNQEGFVTTSGLVRQIDTTGDLQTEVWVDGDTLYLSPSVPGGVTKVKPLAPQQTVIVGFVVYAHKNNGKIFVKVDNGYEISELHDVRITSVANNNVLKYNSSLAVWENVVPITTWITEGTNLYYTQGRFDSAFAAKSTTNLAEGTNLYFTTARGDANFATNFATKTTTNLPEGTNLYFTNQRFDTRFSTKTTTDLAEGTNLYYTQARFNTAFSAKSTTDLAEGTNLYYTDARARAAISENAVGLDYSSGSGVISLTAGYAIPTTVKLGQYDTAYNRSIVSAGVTGTTTKTLSLTQQDANVITASWTDQGITTINGTANQIAANTVGNTTTIAFTNDVTMPNNLVVSGNLTINGTATYVNTQSISAKDPLFEVANDNNTTDAVDIGYYGRYYDTPQTRIEFTGLFRDASDAGKFKFFTGLTVEPTNVVDTTGTGYTVGTLVANVEGNLAGTANAANALTTARTIAASGDATWSVSFNGSANVSSALTLANTGVTATTYGTSTAVPTIAIDSKGRITSASNTNIAFPVTTVNGASGTVVLTTTNIAEGTNQYFTTGKVSAYLTGAISTVLTTDLTASRAVASNSLGKLVSSGTTDTELGYVSGVTSAIQTQLNSKLSTATASSTYLTISNAASTYLPLSGGILTGGLTGTTLGLSGLLSGTNATFTGTLSANSIGINFTPGATGTLNLYKATGPIIYLNDDAYNCTIKTVVTSGTQSNLVFGTQGGTTALTLGYDQSAVFTGSLTAGGLISTTVGNTNQALKLSAATGFLQFTPYYDATYGAFINSLNTAASAYLPLTLQASNLSILQGKVAIGTTSAEGLLTISGTSVQPPTSGSTANSLLQLVGSLNNQLNMGCNTVAGNYGSYIQASDNNLAVPYPLNLQPTGGSVVIGAYSDNGAKLQVVGTSSLQGSVLANTIRTNEGTVSNPYNVWTTMFTIPTNTVGRYELLVVSEGNGGNYTSQATIVVNNSYVAVRNYTDGGVLAIQTSGYDVQCKNGSGASLVIKYKYLRIE